MSEPKLYGPVRRAWLAFAAAIVLGTAPGPGWAQMSAKEFDALPDSDKRAILGGALAERSRAVRNLQSPSETHVYNVAYHDGKAGSMIEDVGRYVCELRRKDGSHRASVDWYLPGESKPLIKVITSMDPSSGEARSVAQHSQLQGVWGAITTEEDTLIKAGHFHYWFGALFDRIEEFPLGVLEKHLDAVQFQGIGPDGRTVQIALEVVTDRGTRYTDTRTVWLDPEKGFLPTRMRRRWEYAATAPNQKPLFTETVTEVKKTEQVDGIWFPTHFTDTSVGRLSLAEGYATVFETTAGPITIGKVTDDAVKVVFDRDVQVQDRVKGVWFVADEATQVAPPPRPAAGRSKAWLIIVNLVTLTMLAGVAAFRSRRRKPEDSVVA